MESFGLKLYTDPASEPLTVAEVKSRLHITITDDDTDLGTMLAQARELCEAACQRAFITQTLTLYLDEFPTEIRLPRPPLVSVVHVKYYDASNVQQTIDAVDYFVASGGEPGRIVPADYWPAIYARPEAIEVRYVAGYGAAAAVPAAAKAAILLTIKALRDDPAAPLPPAARSFLDTLEVGEVR